MITKFSKEIEKAARKKTINSFVYVNNRKKDIFIFGKNQTDGLDETTITAEAEYSVNITKSRKENCLSLHTL